MKNLKFFLSTILFLIFSNVNSQEQIDPPNLTPKDILKTHFDKVIVNDNYKSLKNSVTKTSVLTQMDINGDITNTESKLIQVSTNNKEFITLTGNREDGLTTKVSFDGTKGYTYLKQLNVNTPMDDNTIEIFKKIKPFDFKATISEENINQYSPKVIEENFQGKLCYVLERNVNDVNTIEYYDKLTGLLYGSKFSHSGQQSITVFKDYQNKNGILTARHTISYIKNESLDMITSSIIEDISYNQDISGYLNDSDYSYSSRQINAIPISDAKHNRVISQVASIVGKDTGSSSSFNLEASSNATSSSRTLNKRDIELQEILKNKNVSSVNFSTSNSTVNSSGKRADVEDLEDDYSSFDKLKYRRSSLYTLMINDPGRERNEVIRNAFGDAELSVKFNNHNIGPYLIPGSGVSKDRTEMIENYLNNNNVARELVAKWFNRKPDGSFDMDLIAKRGQYNASDLNKQIAENSKRGQALLKDAGEELIGNTYVIVYDYKYTNKAETAKKRGGFLRTISSVASFIPGAEDVVTVAESTKLVSDVVGKGYFVRTTTYLYQLVWDEATANKFYSDYWIDASNPDTEKRDAFDRANFFKLKYVGSEVSRNNLQSTIFTDKSDNELIEIASVKAIDKNISKLQRTFEQFRVKTPLYSGNPISAKIGTKEGIEKGDKFEVLEQIIDKEGITTYKRIGTIKVDGKNIWNNTYLDNTSEDSTSKTEKNNNQLNYTLFKGSKNKFASGMLIRQIN